MSAVTRGTVLAFAPGELVGTASSGDPGKIDRDDGVSRVKRLLHEELMNCPGCNTTIDYRYLSCCPKCGFESLPLGTDEEICPPAKCAQEETKARRFSRALANSACVLAAAFTGLVSGGFVFYFVGGAMYLIFFAGNLTGGEACARGMAFGALSILTGSFLGTVGGSVLAVKHLIQRY
jgi:hypothetical protein